MSVKRYQPVAQCVEPSYQAQMIVPKVMEFSEGEYVLHADYARLKAEVERLTNCKAEADYLKAEVERLRKAGDAMERSLAFAYPDSPKIKDWQIAKEGK